MNSFENYVKEAKEDIISELEEADLGSVAERQYVRKYAFGLDMGAQYAYDKDAKLLEFCASEIRKRAPKATFK